VSRFLLAHPVQCLVIVIQMYSSIQVVPSPEVSSYIVCNIAQYRFCLYSFVVASLIGHFTCILSFLFTSATAAASGG